MPDRGALDDGDNERRAQIRGALAARRPHLHVGLQQPRARQGGERHRRRISSARRSREIVKDPDDRKAAAAEQPSDRHQAHLRRHRLFRDLQPAERHAGRHQVQTRSRRSPTTRVRVGGKDYEVDALVLATGFDAMTGSVAQDRHPRPRRPDAEPRNGRKGPRTYLGLMSAGFPNLFIITGPGSPSVLSNMIVSIEQHVDWIADCIGLHARARPRHHRGDGRRRGQMGRPRQRGRRRPRSIRRPIPGTWAPTSPASRASSCPISAASAPYRQICNDVAAKGYEGFVMERGGARAKSWQRHDAPVIAAAARSCAHIEE